MKVASASDVSAYLAGAEPETGLRTEKIQCVDIQYVKYYTGVNKILDAREILSISTPPDPS
jgi:hypothetical protein